MSPRPNYPIHGCTRVRLHFAILFFGWGGKKMRASNMKRSFQNGSLVLLVGLMCWWLGSSNADSRSIHH